ncbi:3'-5' exonuclease [Luteirhabdus pelagi]|uniref:3'-5' exonuclease n=1 Tax=Luteirhabdus pelagi TaxID=2792783 RepID=UPI001939B509|nr:3'-5' exonuclease [Luteirhabdus pelagi]MCT8340655.1 3'-5' exonuclease [Thermobacterium salinum]
MFGWFSHKRKSDLPDFWKEYEVSFKKTSTTDITQKRFVVFDTETTGLSPGSDKILSIGAIAVKGKAIFTKDSLELFLQQEKFTPESVPIHGLLKGGERKKISELEALAQFLNYIKSSTLVAHHASFDRAMVNNALKLHGLPPLLNAFLDTGDLHAALIRKPSSRISLDALCENFNITMHDRHTALGDAYLTAQVFIKLITRLEKNDGFRIRDHFIRKKNSGLL